MMKSVNQYGSRVVLAMCIISLVGCKSDRQATPGDQSSSATAMSSPAAASGPAPGAAASRALELPGVFVSVDWLAAHREHEQLVILDARSAEHYGAGHIAGAHSLPYTATRDTREGRTSDVASIPAISKLFSEVGVDMNTTVVVYGDEEYRPPSFVFWVLEVHGHPAVAVLNGGLQAWQRAGHATSVEVPKRSPKQFVAEFVPERLADKREVYRAMNDDQTILLDSRSVDEYVGRKSKGERKGHIPGALHVDAKQSLETEGGVCSARGPEELASLYSSLDKSKTVYTYCNTGRSASVNYLMLRSLGYNVAVYDGSWLEWSADNAMPVSAGEQTDGLE